MLYEETACTNLSLEEAVRWFCKQRGYVGSWNVLHVDGSELNDAEAEEGCRYVDAYYKEHRL